MQEDTLSPDKITRNTLWQTYDGRIIPIKNLEDSHILNLLNYLTNKIKGLKKDIKNSNNKYIKNIFQTASDKSQAVLKVIDKEIDRRKLDRSLVAGDKTLPFQDKNGNWMEWKTGSPLPTKIPQSIDFINPLKEKIDCKLKC